MPRGCYHITDEKTGKRVHIPICWSAVIRGEGQCTCYPKKAPSESAKKDYIIWELQKENAQLRRIIHTLTKRKLAAKKKRKP